MCFIDSSVNSPRVTVFAALNPRVNQVPCVFPCFVSAIMSRIMSQAK